MKKLPNSFDKLVQKFYSNNNSSMTIHEAERDFGVLHGNASSAFSKGVKNGIFVLVEKRKCSAKPKLGTYSAYRLKNPNMSNDRMVELYYAHEKRIKKTAEFKAQSKKIEKIIENKHGINPEVQRKKLEEVFQEMYKSAIHSL